MGMPCRQVEDHLQCITQYLQAILSLVESFAMQSVGKECGTV